ncbi:MAG: transcription elongation factor GreA [bacterium]
MARMPMTRGGYEALRERLKVLKTTERRQVAEELEIARAHGDLRENADYEAAKDKQGMLEATIRDLEDKLARAEVIDVSRLSGEVVKFGATVTLFDPANDSEQTVTIVGEVEADAKAGLISVTSPMARALINRRIDDTVRFETPGGRKEYEITDVKYEP